MVSTSPDGHSLVFVQNFDLWRFPLGREGNAERMIGGEHRELFGQISSKARWLLYQGDELGKRGRLREFLANG